MNKPLARPTQTMPGLDLLRFMAAVLVMLFHFAFIGWANPQNSVPKLWGLLPAFPELSALTWFGWVGVEVFFVISGFVIAFTAQGATPFRFLQSRIVRLVPAAWICATITFAVVALLSAAPLKVSVSRYLASLVFLPTGPWIDNVFWTLPIEISFYALVFMLLSAGRHDRLERLGAAIGLLSAFAWAVFLVLQGTPWADTAESVIRHRVAHLAMLTYGSQFALGILLWATHRHGLNWRRGALIAITAAASLCEIWNATHILPDQGATHIGPAGVPMMVWAGAMAFMGLSLWANPLLCRFLPPVPMRWLGLMTYPLYLIHNVVGTKLMLTVAGAGHSRYTALAAAMIATTALAAMVAFAVEPFFQNRLRRTIGRAGDALALSPRFSGFLFRTARQG